MEIRDVKARMIFDSRGNPTIEATVYTDKGVGIAAAPSGASTGSYEAVELRDKGERYHGKGVSKALSHTPELAQGLKGMDPSDQKAVDSKMIEIDGTKNKGRIGANLIVAVSMANARAAANAQGKELYEYLNPEGHVLPIPMMNIINGGKHAGSGLAIQEFMIVPKGAKTFSEAMMMGSEVYHTLKKEITERYGKGATGLGDEGGFAPPISSTKEAIELILGAVDKSGYSKEIMVSLDAAASEFYKDGKYHVDGKELTAEELKGLYLDLIKEYPIYSIEDPFEENAFEDFAALQKETSIKIVGDDLVVTNKERISQALEKGSMNTLLLKVNQIGTLTEAIEAANLMFTKNMNVIVSHRSGETCDTFIADLAVALNTGHIKTGAPARSERVAKYNRLLKIEDLLGSRAKYGI